MAHDHNCFDEAKKTHDEMKKTDDRISFFIYVDGPDNDDMHFHGNTASMGRILAAMVRAVEENHEEGKCPHCDATAVALLHAYEEYKLAMMVQNVRGSC